MHLTKKCKTPIAIILAMGVAWFIIKTIFTITPLALLAITTAYLALFITFYISDREMRQWFRKNEILFMILAAIGLPTFLFFYQIVGDASEKDYKYEISLKEENNRNISHLKSIVHDLPHDKNTLFWRDFSLSSYQQYWDYISLNYSQECKNLYAAMTINLGEINNINNSRRALAVTRAGFISELQKSAESLDGTFRESMLGNASSTLGIAHEIIKGCQKF